MENTPASIAFPPPSKTSAVKRRIVIVEDHPITRRGVMALIAGEPDLEVCGETDSAPKALDLIRSTQPDLAIIDISLKNVSGIELMKNIKSVMPELPLLVMTMHEESLYAERALRAGARGYVMKHEGPTQIIAAIRTVLNNELFLSETMKEMMLDRLVNKRRGDDSMFAIDSLTDREMEVFQLIGTGFSTRQIATTLNLSSKTVDSHRDHLKLKLRLESGAELVRTAVQWMKTEYVR